MSSGVERSWQWHQQRRNKRALAGDNFSWATFAALTAAITAFKNFPQPDHQPQHLEEGVATDVAALMAQVTDMDDLVLQFDGNVCREGLGKSATLTGTAFNAMEGCAVALHRFLKFLGEKGRLLIWDDHSEEWQSM